MVLVMVMSMVTMMMMRMMMIKLVMMVMMMVVMTMVVMRTIHIFITRSAACRCINVDSSQAFMKRHSTA